MKVWHIIVIIVLILIGVLVYFDNQKETNPKQIPVFTETNSDSLYNIIDSLKAANNILEVQAQSVKLFTKKKTKEYYEKDNYIISLYADSTIKLFADWNRQLQDSNYRERYFCLSTDTIH